MSRGSRKSMRRTGAARVSRAAVLAVFALVVVGAAGVFVWRARQASAPDAPAAAVPAASGASALDAASAYREGARLYAAGRHLEAVPYFRRVGELTPGAPRDYHMQFVKLLVLAAQQSRTDLPQPATRSSIERVALMNEALAHLDLARQLSATPREAAAVHVTRADVWRVWGFPWEGLLELRAAAAADPSWHEVAVAGDLIARRLRDPATPLPGLELEDLAGQPPGR